MHPIKASLDKISKTFCSAKWLQVTMRLQNGHTHSCHHPKTHVIPLEELKQNPSALHNTEYKKTVRKLMLEGHRPAECSYCWKAEDLPGDQISDRFLKSAEDWSTPNLEKIKTSTWNDNINPTYVEVSFSNICNFKCAYCFPDVSSQWMKESIKYGPYPTSNLFGSIVSLSIDKTMPIKQNKNEYITAFWKWLPTSISSLRVLRVTGGEPLLSTDCYRLLDFLNQNPAPNLELSLNSNLGISEFKVKQTLLQLKKLKQENKIKSASIFTSIDTWGEQAEYVRFGLDLNLWKKNLELCLMENDWLKTNIMVAFNALAIFNFKELLAFCLNKKKEFNDALAIDVSILHNPPFLNPLVFESESQSLIQESLQFMNLNSDKDGNTGFNEYEITKVRRLAEYVKTKLEAHDLENRKKDLVLFLNEYDRRKKTNYKQTFPEIVDRLVSWSLAKHKTSLRQNFKTQAHKYVGRLLVFMNS